MFLIGIAGGSGSGKTTFAEKIFERVGDPRASVLHHDSYYLSDPPANLMIKGKPNFDHPEAFDWELLRAHLTELRQGNDIQVPVYDYENNRRSSEVRQISGADVVVLEGIFVLWDEAVRDLCDLRVFLHVEADIRLIRRLHRDVHDRGRTVDSTIRQYYDTVRPMHNKYVEPTRQYADLMVGEETDRAADAIAARLAQILSP